MWLGTWTAGWLIWWRKVKLLDAKQQQRTLTSDERVEILNLKGELRLARNWIHIFWRQRAKQQLIQQSDQNIKFFHWVANNRRKFKAIQNIKVNCEVHENFFIMANLRGCYLMGFLTTPLALKMPLILRKVFQRKKCGLRSWFREWKSSGPDGFNIAFSQGYC